MSSDRWAAMGQVILLKCISIIKKKNNFESFYYQIIQKCILLFGRFTAPDGWLFSE